MTFDFDKIRLPGYDPLPQQNQVEDIQTIYKRQLAISERQHNLRRNSIAVFMQEMVQLDSDSTISSAELYAIYSAWCRRENAVLEPMRALCYRLKHGSYPVKATVFYQGKKQCRGFRGLRIAEHDACDT